MIDTTLNLFYLVLVGCLEGCPPWPECWPHDLSEDDDERRTCDENANLKAVSTPLITCKLIYEKSLRCQASHLALEGGLKDLTIRVATSNVSSSAAVKIADLHDRPVFALSDDLNWRKGSPVTLFALQSHLPKRLEKITNGESVRRRSGRREPLDADRADLCFLKKLAE